MVPELSWINGFCYDYFYKTAPLPLSTLFAPAQLRLLTFQARAGSTTSRNIKHKTVTHGRMSGWLPMSLLIDTQSRSCKSWLTWPPALMASAFLSSKSKSRGRSWRPTSTVQSLSSSNCAKVLKTHWRSWGVHTWEKDKKKFLGKQYPFVLPQNKESCLFLLRWSGLRILYCHSCGWNLISGLGTSIYYRSCREKKKKILPSSESKYPISRLHNEFIIKIKKKPTNKQQQWGFWQERTA